MGWQSSRSLTTIRSRATAHLVDDVHQLELLAELGRILPEESIKLAEYHRLLEKILILPGFEFTATFGFHILGIFSPEKPLREIEFLLLDLNIPADQLDDGSATVGATVGCIDRLPAHG